MQHETKSVQIVGVVPYIPHNVQLADPLCPITRRLKEVQSKKKKTDSDHELIARTEWEGSFYLLDSKTPVIPSANLEALIQDGAKINKRGREAKAGVFVPQPAVLKYDGPSDIDALYKNKKYVLRVSAKVQQSRVIRTRPQFPEWSAEFEVQFYPDVITWENILEALGAAGQLKGLGDWRPKFGRFEVK